VSLVDGDPGVPMSHTYLIYLFMLIVGWYILILTSKKLFNKT
jgi:hypothetical protein